MTKQPCKRHGIIQSTIEQKCCEHTCKNIKLHIKTHFTNDFSERTLQKGVTIN